MISWLVTSAWAGVPVLFDGRDAAGAIDAVARRTGLPEDQLDPLPLSRVLEASPNARGDGVLRRCSTAAVERDPIRADYARAKAAWVNGDRFRAMDQLDLAVSKIGCLSQVVDPEVAARVFLLRGALNATDDTVDPATSRGELRTAIEFVRDLAFDDSLPEDARPVFDAVRAEVADADSGELATLSVVPSRTVSGPWVDGRQVVGSMDLRPGLHLFQYSSAEGVRSGWLSLGGAAEVVLPGQVRGPVLERMVEAEGHALVGALLDVAVEPLTAAYVLHGGGLWLLSKGDSGIDVTVIASADAPKAPAESDETEKKKKKKKKRRKRREKP